MKLTLANGSAANSTSVFFYTTYKGMTFSLRRVGDDQAFEDYGAVVSVSEAFILEPELEVE